MTKGIKISKQPESRLNDLRANCERCFGLCCVALPYASSADFPIDKEAGIPCPNLQSDFSCGVHNSLREKGFRGCSVYDCFGAGQKVAQVTFAGIDWRDAPETANQMFTILPIMQQLHEMLWYLNEALTFNLPPGIQDEMERILKETERLADLEPEAMVKLEIPSHRNIVSGLLQRTSEWVRAPYQQNGKNAQKRKKTYGRGLDFMGANLRKSDFRGSNLRGAFLIAANLREADLRNTDLLGADLRDTDIRGADLTGCIFLTQAQVNAARGDRHTKLPPLLKRPAHWSGL